ncbi:hypothetical protein [Roseibium sediminicola]|uniref:DUF3592 domain-containing protein n=1 Tax=Roseibium sediminicola TaxID=2933272 RepID=A0ABT0GQ97_9HYPH|nr:hypothetical protein [Roseibium sp. CAU 1639]MCK7611583.1 hypothetical protein [Roseibium sp. CAU 1639]
MKLKLKLIFSFLFLLVIGPALFFLDGAIIKDLRLKFDTLAPAYIATTDRECRSKLFLFHHCSYDYVYENEDLDQSYFFVSFGAPKTLTLLKSNGTGELTSDVGQDYLWNRILMILFMPALLVWILVKYMSTRRAQTVPERPAPRQQPQTQPRQSAHAGLGQGRKEFGRRR